ncbi:MAG TPA: DUF935 family protein, partial [Rhodospirillales bacterium]|nr:DUF935 family protein [Rhodospirillales bacterium]
MIGGLKQRIGAALVSAGNVLARRPVPPQGRLLKYQSSDYRRDSVSDGLTPKKARSVLLAADGGDLSEAMRLFSEMEDKDARLQSVLSTRRLTLTGMDWEVVSAAELEKGIVDKVLADESAAFCRDRLSGLHDFDQALTDLALAIGPGLAALALVWNGNKLVAIDPVPEMRPFIDFNRDKRVRIARTQGDRVGFLGVPPNFVVHMPHARHGLPMRGSLMRSIVLIYLIRNYAIKDWAVFSEVFGMPVRIGRYDPQATPEEKFEMMSMLQTLGTDAVG